MIIEAMRHARKQATLSNSKPFHLKQHAYQEGALKGPRQPKMASKDMRRECCKAGGSSETGDGS